MTNELTWRPIIPAYLPKAVIDRFPLGPREAFVASPGGFGVPVCMDEIFYALRCCTSPWWYLCNARGDVETDPTGGHRKRFRTSDNAKAYASLHYKPAKRTG